MSVGSPSMEQQAVAPEAVLPVVTERNAFFWHAGAEGALQILRCQSCGYYLHPPYPFCPECHSRSVGPEPVSGRGVVHTFTVNIQQWTPGAGTYVVALVELVEQRGLRLTSNIVGCRIDAVHIGMPVKVVFFPRDDIWLPLFSPVEAA
jgi:uncharacterized OB-fold protein